METKFTPGPWKIHGFFITAQHGERAKSVVADIDRHAWTKADEVKANARLIAAAPDLFQACKYVADWHRENDSGEGELFGLDFVTTCIAAIAKATRE